MFPVWAEAVAATSSLIILMVAGCLMGYLASVYLKPAPTGPSYFDVAGGSKMTTSFIHIEGDKLEEKQVVTLRKPAAHLTPGNSIYGNSRGISAAPTFQNATDQLPPPSAELLRNPSVLRDKTQPVPLPDVTGETKPKLDTDESLGSAVSPSPPTTSPPPLRDTLYPDDPQYATPMVGRKNIDSVVAFDNDTYAVPRVTGFRPTAQPPPPPVPPTVNSSTVTAQSPSEVQPAANSTPKLLRAAVSVSSPVIPRSAVIVDLPKSAEDLPKSAADLPKSPPDLHPEHKLDVPSDDDSIY